MKLMRFRTGIAQICLHFTHLCSEGFSTGCPLSEWPGNGGAALEAVRGAVESRVEGRQCMLCGFCRSSTAAGCPHPC